MSLQALHVLTIGRTTKSLFHLLRISGCSLSPNQQLLQYTFTSTDFIWGQMANFFDDAGFVNGADLVEDYPAVGFDAFCFEASRVRF